MDNINVTPEFVRAGSATFTVSNGLSNHFTYRVKMAEPSTKYPNASWFMYVLTGADNTDDDNYTYVGQVIPVRDVKCMLKLTYKSKYPAHTKIWRVAEWALRAIWQVAYRGYQLPARMSIKHIGQCGRCGRALTTPASLDTGLGPECASMLGVPWEEHSHYTGPTLLDVPVENIAEHPGHPSNYGDR